jgi:hypothetical protein
MIVPNGTKKLFQPSQRVVDDGLQQRGFRPAADQDHQAEQASEQPAGRLDHGAGGRDLTIGYAALELGPEKRLDLPLGVGDDLRGVAVVGSQFKGRIGEEAASVAALQGSLRQERQEELPDRLTRRILCGQGCKQCWRTRSSNMCSAARNNSCLSPNVA